MTTYSKRNPTVTTRKVEVETLDEIPLTKIMPSLEHKREEGLLASISATIRQLDIQPSITSRSRKSEIRPRHSIAPTHREYSDLLECCKLKKESSFKEWFTDMQEYMRPFNLADVLGCGQFV